MFASTTPLIAEDLELQVSTLGAELSQKVKELSALAHIQTEFESSRKRESDLQHRLENLQSQLTSAQTELSTAVHSHESRVTQLQEESDARIQLFEQSVSEKSQSLHDLQTRYDECQTRVTELEEKIDQLNRDHISKVQTLEQTLANSQQTKAAQLDIRPIMEDIYNMTFQEMNLGDKSQQLTSPEINKAVRAVLKKVATKYS